MSIVYSLWMQRDINTFILHIKPYGRSMHCIQLISPCTPMCFRLCLNAIQVKGSTVPLLGMLDSDQTWYRVYYMKRCTSMKYYEVESGNLSPLALHLLAESKVPFVPFFSVKGNLAVATVDPLVRFAFSVQVILLGRFRGQ
ncbi:hypothetical protein BDB01DRAFT_834591 [Pilobolus umbonatus]|nr:hypothetical protein BDB01DRAFT_834591 [Pilobolus umbonatus]